MDDPFDLQRFVTAQGPVYDGVLAELRTARKTSHWMWFIFPQLAALGRSAIAKRYGIVSRDEAVAYWRHPLLGRRLEECAELVLAAEGRSALQIFGSPDDLKLRSCMTLFEAAAPDPTVFRRVIDKYYDGAPDGQTTALL
jgi:uncharacterized protein (DUF1810 family)